MITKIYGMRQYKILDANQIATSAEKLNIPLSKLYILDSSYYKFLLSLKDSLPEISKNHLQPLQALYYDRDGRLSGILVNCYAPGFPNLQWNKFSALDTFPPSDVPKILDSTFTLQLLSKFIKDRNCQTIPNLSLPHSEYYVVVIWTKFMGRQSKRFIRIIEQNIEIETTKSVFTIYINADNIFCKEDF